MKYDLIIVSKSTPQLRHFTDNCIKTARQDNADLNVIIVETSGLDVTYNAKVIKYTGDFNYHRAMNLGLKEAVGDVYIIANNDIVFFPGWSQIGDQMIWNGFDSASALSNCPEHRNMEMADKIIPGYDIGRHITGWCIFMTKECYRRIGKLSEEVNFWCSDNIYADQLMEAGLKHGLFCNVRVNHATSMTLRTVSRKLMINYQVDQLKKYKLIKNAKRERTA